MIDQVVMVFHTFLMAELTLEIEVAPTGEVAFATSEARMETWLEAFPDSSLKMVRTSEADLVEALKMEAEVASEQVETHLQDFHDKNACSELVEELPISTEVPPGS
jgi:hypothetical protein